MSVGGALRSDAIMAPEVPQDRRPDLSYKTWTRDEIVAFSERHGVTLSTPEDMDRMAMLATKVTGTGASIKRMPSKGHEPASVFKVPL